MGRAALKAVQQTFDMESPILDLAGKAIEENGAKVLLRDLCINALLFQRQDDKATEQEKLDRFILAMLIRKRRHPKLTATDIVTIRGRIAEIYPPLLVGRVFEILDPESVVHREDVA